MWVTNPFFAVAAVLGRHAHVPAQRLKFRFAQNINPFTATDEDNAFLRRALGQEIHGGHAITAGDEQGSLAPALGHGETVAERCNHT